MKASYFLAFGALALVACSSDERDVDADLARAAERARELPFLRKPRVERQTRASYVATASERGQSRPDEDIADLRAVYGRLGFIPKSYDPRRADGEVAELVGASYSVKAQTITLFESPRDDIYVHELVHALQDQHFDLAAFDDRARSSDAFLARRSVTEGDATLGEYRFATGGNFRVLQELLDVPGAERRADMQLSNVQVPRYFLAYASFVYGFGGALAARTAGVFEGTFASEKLAALWGDAAPESTEEVIVRAQGRQVDPIEPVGLAALPKELANDFDIVTVDRLGLWQIFLLIGDRALVDAWDGDQLVVIGERDLSVSPKRRPPVAIVWTSIWDDATNAQHFAALLKSVQDAANDDEEMILDQTGKEVVLVKGSIPRTQMQVLADAALRRPPTLPPLVPRMKIPELVLP